MKRASTAILLDRRFALSDGSYRVKLRITFERKQKYYPLPEKLTEEEWESVHQEKARGKAKTLQLYFKEIELRAQETIKDLLVFTFDGFEKKFNRGAIGKQDVAEYFKQHIDGLRKQNREGTAVSYQTALNSFERFNTFRGAKKWLASEITPDWLNEYMAWMNSQSTSVTTVGIYTRSLRTIVNQMIEEGNFPRDLYPFGRRKFVIPAGRNVKKALDKELVKKIAGWECATETFERARDLWLFSYLCNGINFGDIARIKWEHIMGDTLVFYRNKTKNTTRHDIKPIMVPLIDKSKRIIGRWGSRDGEYLFDVISPKDSVVEQRKKIQQFIKTNNKYTKRLAEEMNLDLKLTTYHARHSFATVMMRAGASTEYIKDTLGHSNVKTTESYLGSFDTETKRKFQESLI